MLSGDVLDAMVASGCTAEQIASAVKAACVADERKKAAQRENARIRQQKSRDNRAGHSVSRNVTVTERDNVGQGVTECDTAKTVSLSPVPLLSPTPPNNPLTPKPIQKNNSRGHRLPDDWALQGPDLAYALAKGLTETETASLAERFKSWALSASGPNAKKVNWHQAWQGWVQRDGPKIIAARNPHAKPLTPFQKQQAATQNVLSSLTGANRGSPQNGSPTDRVLSIDQREQPGGVRSGNGGAVLALPGAYPGGSHRSG